MKKKVLLIPLALLLAISLVAIGCPAPPAAKTLKVGGIFSLSGIGSEGEILMRSGAELAMDWINEKGGITVGGERYLIELIIEDGKGSVDGAVAAATKLVHEDQVKFIVGGVVPPFVMAAASVTEPAKVLRSLCWGGSGPLAINPDTPYTFRPVMADAEMLPSLYEYLASTYPDVKTVALSYSDEPGGHAYIEISQMMAEAHGLTVVAREFNPMGTEDYYPVWTKLLAAEPDAVDAGCEFIGGAARKLKQGRELGFTGPMFTLSPINLYDVLGIVGKDFSYDYFNPSLDIQSPEVPPMVREVKERWEAKLTEPFNPADSVWGWDVLWCLVQAIEAAQSLDSTEVAATWEKMESIETCFGTGHMGGLQTYGINHLVVRPVPVSTLEKGEVELVKWYSPQIP